MSFDEQLYLGKNNNLVEEEEEDDDDFWPKIILRESALTMMPKGLFLLESISCTYMIYN